VQINPVKQRAGYDPFTNPELGRPKGNETQIVAILLPAGSLTLGQRIRKRRMESKKNLTECAKELAVSVKTMRDRETDRRRPNSLLQKRITKFLQLNPTPKSSKDCRKWQSLKRGFDSLHPLSYLFASTYAFYTAY
jgi:DNA-binding XRE family transcriptional regulator